MKKFFDITVMVSAGLGVLLVLVLVKAIFAQLPASIQSYVPDVAKK